jgi:hypothetical protein
MTAPLLSDVEVIQLVEAAQAQLDEYLRLSQLASASTEPPVWTAMPTYSWDNPTELTVSDVPYAIVVQPTADA